MKLSSEPNLVKTAQEADAVLSNFSHASGSAISFDKPLTGLHTSLFYFCCHGPVEIVKMQHALNEMQWESFEVVYDDIACNLDHNNVTIYLHALPTDQQQLFALATLMEDTLTAAGIPIRHPRKSKFHMTLARVNHTYPVDNAMAALSGKRFGSHRVCEFNFAGTSIKSSDYSSCKGDQE